MRKILFIITFLCLSFHSSICFSDSLGDVEEFLQSLSNPNLSDYYRFNGQGAETEMQLVFMVCREKGWIPPEQNEKCLQYLRSREADPKNTPSLYMSWLRTKIPKFHRIEISGIKRFEGKGTYNYELIFVNLDNSTITFFKTLDQDNCGQFGMINVSKINGISVNDLLEHDINEGLIQNLIKDIYK